MLEDLLAVVGRLIGELRFESLHFGFAGHRPSSSCQVVVDTRRSGELPRMSIA